jgi:anaerobic selenocysteine-containing dehydrogenase
MDRRDFIRLTAITGTSATLASCGSPENLLIRFIPEEELIPGVAVWKPSICPLCPAGCGLQVRVMEGEAEVVRNGRVGVIKMGLAKKLEGNPAHPVNRGKLCPRGQAAIQLTYHPDRVAQPLKRTGARGTGQFQPVTWDEGLSEILTRLDALAASNDQQSLAFLARPRTGQRRELVAEFLDRFGAPPPVEFELFSEDVLRRANALSFGHEQLPTFDLEQSRYVLVFGADFLGTWNSPVSQNIGYGAMRQGRPGIRAKLVQVEARMSPTGANADEWVAVRPGMEGVLALGLAHVILGARLRPGDAAGRAGAMIDGWANGLPDYAPSQVEKQTGVAAARIERLAREFSERSPAVAVIGGSPLAQTNGLFHALAVNALNALVGSVGKPGGIFFTPRPASAPRVDGTAQSKAALSDHDRDRRPRRTLERLAAEITGGQGTPVHVLLLDDSNPVFAAPPAWRVREALDKIPFIVSFGSFVDDTSVLADLILPDHSFLESWVDGSPESGTTLAVASVAPPAMRPLHQTRAMPDVLLEIGRRLGRPLRPPFEWQTFDAMLHAAFARLPTGPGPAGDVWKSAQERGGWWSEVSDAPAAKVGEKDRPAATTKFVEPQFDGDAPEYPFHFLPYASQAFLDGSLAHLPWLQELPDVLSTAMWSSWVEINPRTAERLTIGDGDLVSVTSRHGTLRVPALLSPGLAPDVIAMPVGQGHQTFTRYASARGANPISILAPMIEPNTGSLAWAATRVRISRAGGGGKDKDGRLILFAGAMRERQQER